MNSQSIKTLNLSLKIKDKDSINCHLNTIKDFPPTPKTRMILVYYKYNKGTISQLLHITHGQWIYRNIFMASSYLWAP